MKYFFYHKLRYEEYLELICRCLLDDMYTEVTCMNIPYAEITCIYEKACMMVM